MIKEICISVFLQKVLLFYYIIFRNCLQKSRRKKVRPSHPPGHKYRSEHPEMVHRAEQLAPGHELREQVVARVRLEGLEPVVGGRI